jgi:hypothetical protein
MLASVVIIVFLLIIFVSFAIESLFTADELTAMGVCLEQSHP